MTQISAYVLYGKIFFGFIADMSTYITPSTQGASMIASVVAIYKSIYDTPNTHDAPTVVCGQSLCLAGLSMDGSFESRADRDNDM